MAGDLSGDVECFTLGVIGCVAFLSYDSVGVVCKFNGSASEESTLENVVCMFV